MDPITQLAVAIIDATKRKANHADMAMRDAVLETMDISKLDKRIAYIVYGVLCFDYNTAYLWAVAVLSDDVDYFETW